MTNTSLTNKTILEVIENPSLLGKSFRKRLLRADSWAPWKAYMSAFFGLPFESAASYELFKKCTGRTTAPTKAFKESFIVCGRRGGKSHTIATIGTFAAGFMDFSAFLSPGEVPTVVIVASDRTQAGIILKYIKANFAQSPILRQMIASDLKEGLSLKSGLEIQVMTGDFRSIRGRTIVCALLDELAFFSADGSTPDSELLAAIRPSMISVPNSFLIGISSPYSRRGILFREYEQHYGVDTSETLIWKADSLTMNPTLNQKAIAAAYAKDPVSAASEFGGLFRSDSESYVSREAVEACIERGIYERAPRRSETYYAFVDPSGGRSDSFTMAIGHLDGSTTVLDCVCERPSPCDPDSSVAVYADILKRYHLSECTGDRYAGAWPEEAFSKRGILYRASEKDRSSIYVDFLPQLMSRQTRLLDDARIVNQLTSLERRVGAGRDKIDHPAGANYHDDIANCVAGCLDLCAGNAGTFGGLDYLSDLFKGIVQGRSSDRALPEMNRYAQDAERNRAFEMERKLYELERVPINPCTQGFWKTPQPPKCPRCGETQCLTWLGADECRCGQCGKQWPPSGQWAEVTVATRAGLATVRMRTY
jgi:hypothetical protein